MSRTTIGSAMDMTKRRLLATAFCDSASSETFWLLEKVTGLHQPALLLRTDQELPDDQAEMLEGLVARYEAGEPLPYILGEWYFYGIRFSLTPDVLIPRPETELLVEEAVRWLKFHPNCDLFADIGTGSGCIPIAILLNAGNPALCGVAVDISEKALEVARSNRDAHELTSRLKMVQDDLSFALSNDYSLVTANLPYIPRERLLELRVSQHEPPLALDGGEDGFNLYRRLFADLQPKMAVPFLILCEIDFLQEKMGQEIARQFFPDAKIRILQDYAGFARILSIQQGE